MELPARLFCGDCNFLPWPDATFDMVLCSPPYEDARRYGELGFKRRGLDWVEWLTPRVFEAARVCKGLVAVVVNGRTDNFEWSGTPLYLYMALKTAGLSLRKPLIYQRSGIPGSGGPDWLRDDYELVICAQARRGRLPWADNTAMGRPPKFEPGGAPSHRTETDERVGRVMMPRVEGGTRRRMIYTPPALANPGNVIKGTVGGGQMGHKLAHENEAPYPEWLCEFLIKSFCRPGGVVLDVFSGSGTTLAAALKCGRRGVGVDIRQSQIDLARRRLLDECGVDAPAAALHPPRGGAASSPCPN